MENKNYKTILHNIRSTKGGINMLQEKYKQHYYELLSPNNSALVLIDYQPQMIFGIESSSRTILLNNVSGICKTL